MHDRDDEETMIQDDSLERLDTVSYHLTELYKLLAKDRDSWAVTGGDLAKAVEELQKQTQKFAGIDQAFRNQLAKFIREESKQAATTVTQALNQSIKEATTQEVAAVTQKLEAGVDRAVAMIDTYNKQMDKVNNWWIPGVMVIGAIFGSMIGAYTVNFAHDHPGYFSTSTPVVVQESHKKPKAD